MALFLLKPKRVPIIYASVTVQAATANQAQLANKAETLLPSQAVLKVIYLYRILHTDVSDFPQQLSHVALPGSFSM